MPRITQISLRKFVKEQLVLNMQSDTYLNLLSSYLLYNRVVAKSEFDFKSQKEYDEYLNLNPPTTVNNETVKSYGEMDIANFLMQNGIQYIYEHPYEIDTRTSEYGQYHPDFYLPDYKIYIEYFGINRNGEVPSYFKAANGMSATEAYRASMEWKRATHREHQTTMIECFAYEKLEDALTWVNANAAAGGLALLRKICRLYQEEDIPELLRGYGHYTFVGRLRVKFSVWQHRRSIKREREIMIRSYQRQFRRRNWAY